VTFGCVVEYRGADGKVHHGEYLGTEDGAADTRWARVNIGHTSMDVRGIGICPDDKLRIIGHEPRLIHVLQAIEKQKGMLVVCGPYGGGNSDEPPNLEVKYVVAGDERVFYWFLTSDNLDDCDDKTIEVLHSILIKE